jgi:23S rRNA (pseudouridine1915-N3)-methyltransferase
MLGRFCDARVIEVADEKPGKLDGAGARRAEGARLLEKCRGYVVACDAGGKRFTSESFSGKIGDVMLRGVGDVSFLVGGSGGLSGETLRRADLRLSFSDMTLPHRLFRIVLIEQVYRAFKIMRGETYHK